MQNNLLGICIPTYNRAEKLKDCIKSFINDAIRYNIPIYISDNSSTDNTEQVVLEFKKKYENIFYYKQSKNLGLDLNMTNVICMANTEYALWLGDDDTIMQNGIEKILNKLQNTPDLLLLNPLGDIKDSYNNPYNFYYDYGQIGINGFQFSTIVVKVNDIQRLIPKDKKTRFDGTLHTYAGLTLDYLMQKFLKENKIFVDVIKEKIINIDCDINNKSWKNEKIDTYSKYIPLWFSKLLPEYKNNSIVQKKYNEFLIRLKSLDFIQKSNKSIPFRIVKLLPICKLKFYLAKKLLVNR